MRPTSPEARMSTMGLAFRRHEKRNTARKIIVFSIRWSVFRELLTKKTELKSCSAAAAMRPTTARRSTRIKYLHTVLKF